MSPTSPHIEAKRAGDDYQWKERLEIIEGRQSHNWPCLLLNDNSMEAHLLNFFPAKTPAGRSHPADLFREAVEAEILEECVYQSYL